MIDYGLKNKVVLITGANNPQGIGATTALLFAREGAKVVLVYKKIARAFDKNKLDRNGADRYYAANAGNADEVEPMRMQLKISILPPGKGRRLPIDRIPDAGACCAGFQ